MPDQGKGPGNEPEIKVPGEKEETSDTGRETAPLETKPETPKDETALSKALNISEKGSASEIKILLKGEAVESNQPESMLTPISPRLQSYLETIEKIAYSESGVRKEEEDNLEAILALLRSEDPEIANPQKEKELIAKFEEALKLLIEDFQGYKDGSIQILLRSVLKGENADKMIPMLNEEPNRAALISLLKEENPVDAGELLAIFLAKMPKVSLYFQGDGLKKKRIYEIVHDLFNRRCTQILQQTARIDPVVAKIPLIGEVIDEKEAQLRFGQKSVAEVKKEFAEMFDDPAHQKIARMMVALHHCPAQINNTIAPAEAVVGQVETIKALKEDIADSYKEMQINYDAIASQFSPCSKGKYREIEIQSGLLEKFKNMYANSLRTRLIEGAGKNVPCSMERSINILKGLIEEKAPALDSRQSPEN